MGLSHFNVTDLLFFRSPHQKDYKCLTVEAIVDTVSRAKVDPKLKDALVHSFVIAKIPKFYSVNARLDPGSDLGILAL